jgi:hypothetical protein
VRSPASSLAVAIAWIDHYAVGMKDPEGNEFDIN